MPNFPRPPRHHGTSLIEVLVTMVLVAFGLLGIAAFQAKAQVGSIEAYQRAQAVLLLEDMQSRIAGNSAHAADYVGAAGTGDAQPADCSTVAAGSARDLCEWSAALKGAAELQGAASTKVGAMTGARGCITQIQAVDESTGVCTQAIYQLAVSWQGMHPTIAPAPSCGQNQYGDEKLRRAISVRVAVGLPHCV